MPSLRAIRGRIRSVKNIAKITKAMEMVAASKMRRAQQRTLASRPYAQKLHELLGDLASQSGAEFTAPLLERRPINRIMVVHITADRGLAGAFSTNMNRRTGNFLLEQSVPASVIAVGRKGRDFMVRSHRELRAEFTDLTDRPSLLDTLPISRIVMDDFQNGLVDAVYLAYSEFVNTLVQRPTIRQILPIEAPQGVESRTRDFLYEPGPEELLSALCPRYIEFQVYQAILESIASEQSARMVAMRNATDNAKEVISELTLQYNKARQESITKELLEIAGGAAALSA